MFRIQNRELVKAKVGISQFGEQELYGLKLVQLQLPAANHRIELFKIATYVYNKHHTVNENMTASLGVIGSAGFITLLGVLLVPGKKNRFTNLMF